MTIRSDNRSDEKDVSFWLAEKSGTILGKACRMVDILKKNKGSLPDSDLDAVGDLLFNQIFDAAKVMAFAYEYDQMWSREWVDLMFQQGSERYMEFKQRLANKTPCDIPPLEYPASIHEVLNMLRETEDEFTQIIHENNGDKSYIRSRIMKKSKELLRTKNELAISISDKLDDLVDEQAVHRIIDWQEFCNQVLFIVHNGIEETRREGENNKIPWI